MNIEQLMGDFQWIFMELMELIRELFTISCIR